MKRIALAAAVPLLLLGGYFGLRGYNTSVANKIAQRLEAIAQQCLQAVQQQDRQFKPTFAQNTVRQAREEFANLPDWAVSGEAKLRVGAAEQAVEEQLVAVDQFLAQHDEREKEEAARVAQAKEDAQRKEALNRHTETEHTFVEKRAEISAVLAKARPASPATPESQWPLSDPWPNDLRPAKVLIWDEAKGSVHEAQPLLSEALRGTPNDAELLVCAVVKEHLQMVAEYQQPAGTGALAAAPTGKLPAYRMWQAIRLVRYPSGERIGDFTLVGDSPASVAHVPNEAAARRAIVGEYRKPLARWIEGRFKPTGLMEQFMAETDAARAMPLADKIGRDLRSASSAALPYLARKLCGTDDAAMQFQIIRVVQFVKRESTDLQGDFLGNRAAPPIGPPNWETFAPNRQIFVNRVRDWLKRQAPE